VIQPNVSLQPAHVADGTHNVWLVFNFRNSDGSDPVTTIGTNAYQLTPLAIIPYTASLGFKHPTTMKEIPIPPDPNLDYSVLLFQFIIESPTMNVCASEVFGTTIWPEGGEPVALPPGPTLAKQSSRGTTIPETSLRRFIKSAGGMLVTRPAANGFLRACARLRASAQKR
jgi:hypothetical protein